ncbi:MAG: DUF4214 domain-containing protein [Elusimicrobia bacterium]|nr:DUF4214 domain-containing protein [Elusimicrobiota bacterium]
MNQILVALLVLASCVPSLAETPPVDRKAVYLNVLYKAILDREPDEAGLKYWLEDRSDAASLAVNIAISGESRTKTRTDAGWLESAYAAFLGRRADAEGLAYWEDRLADGMSREAVLRSFLADRECREEAARREASVCGALAAFRAADPFSFENFRGANLFARVWLPEPAAMKVLVASAKKMNLNVLRLSVPLLAVHTQTMYGESIELEKLVGDVKEDLDIAAASGIKAIVSLNGYKGYDRDCGWIPSYQSVEDVAEAVIKEAKGHKALFAWDLQNEALSDRPGDCDDATIIKAVHAMHGLVKRIDPKTPITVGEAAERNQVRWNDIVDFASPHLYVGAGLRSPISQDDVLLMQAQLAETIDALRRELGNKPLVLGEFGFRAGDVTEAEQAQLLEAYYRTIRAKGVGGAVWNLALVDPSGGYTMVDENGGFRPAGYIVEAVYPRGSN